MLLLAWVSVAAGIALRNEVSGQAKDGDYLKSVEEHKKLRAAMAASIYRIEKGEVATTVGKNTLTTEQARQLKLIKSAFSHIRPHVRVPEGAKIVFQSLSRKTALITFDNRLPEGFLGADYAARVTVNVETGEVLKALAGS